MEDNYSVNKEPPKEAKRYTISPALEGAILGVFALLLTFITAYFIYTNSMEVLKQEIKDGLLRTVSGIAACLDGDKIDYFTNYTEKDKDKKDYLDMVSLLQKARIGTKHISFLYVNTVRREKENVDGEEKTVDKVYFILDPISIDENGNPIYTDAASLEPSIPMAPYKDYDDILVKCFDDKKSYVTDEPYTDEWGDFYSAYAPILDSKGKVIGTLGADLRINELIDRCHPMVDATKRAFIVSVSLAMLLGTFVWFTRRFTSMLNESRHMIYQNFLVAKRFADQSSSSIGNQFQRTSSILRFTAKTLGTICKIDNKDKILVELKLEEKKLDRFADKLLTLGELKYSKRQKDLENFSVKDINQSIIKDLENDYFLKNKTNNIVYDNDKDIPELLYGPVMSYEELLGHLYELCLSKFNSKVYSKTILSEERSKDVIICQTFAVSVDDLKEEDMNFLNLLCRNISSDNLGEQLELSESINIPIIQELLYILGSSINCEIKDNNFKISFKFVLLKSQEVEEIKA